MATQRKIGLKEAIKLAEDHALGILESTDDAAFWGEDFWMDHNGDTEWHTFARAKKVILNKIQGCKR